ncbi:MAG TPA: MYXO-CTERM sorting domain-containing protein, partial [Kofleriaceae bacterium]|nr:MYXO-CTERM sorting domain-containing protein [Kofleriaceae bacterium]
NTVVKTGGAPTLGRPRGKDCFAEGLAKGRCDAARFAVTDYRLVVPGPQPRAVHAIAATGATKVVTSKLEGMDGGVHIQGPRDAVVAWGNTYRAPRGAAVTHVVLDTPDKLAVTATVDGDTCSVTIQPGTELAAPAVFSLDTNCKLTVDAAAAGASALAGTARPTRPVRKKDPPRRTGCCNAQTTPTSPIAMAFLVALVVVRRRRLAR